MNNSSSFIATGKQSQLQSDISFFDKVINLQFIKRNSKSGNKTAFTIRSDYEMITDNKGNYSFARMPMKPDIRVQYKQVASETAIQIYIHVTNFRTVTTEGAMNNKFSVTEGEETIEEVYIEMGYFNQMPDFTNPSNNLTKEDYLDISKTSGRGTKILKGKILSVYPTKLPPDGITTFMLTVASVTNSLGSPQKLNDNMTYKKYLFESITKRVLRVGIPENVERRLLESGEAMTDSEAEKYGVKILCSKGVLDLPPIEVPPYIGKYDSVLEGFELIQKVNKNIRFFPLPSGDFMARLNTESVVSSIRSAEYIKFIGNEEIKIPAIESLELGATANITCPFFGIIHPFQTLSFQSYFNLASFVNYFLPNSNVSTFFPISCEIDFSTNGKENSIKMMCTREGD